MACGVECWEVCRAGRRASRIREGVVKVVRHIKRARLGGKNRDDSDGNDEGDAEEGGGDASAGRGCGISDVERQREASVAGLGVLREPA